VERFCWMPSFFISAFPKWMWSEGLCHWWLCWGVRTIGRRCRSIAVTTMNVPFLIFSLPILSHLTPSPSVLFPYVLHRSATFRTYLLLSWFCYYVFPSAAVFLWWTLTLFESLDFPSFVSNVLVYSVSDRWHVLTHYSIGTSRSLQ
jgi:hypothetical protein